MNTRIRLFLSLWAAFSLSWTATLSAQNDELPDEKPEEGAEKPRVDDVPDAGNDDFGFKEIEMLSTVIELIRQNYVDENEVTYEKLINSALEGMLANLDPHCQFMHPALFEQMKQDTGGTYEGVGVTIALRNETLTIVAVREDGPAARAGVLPGDKIVKINEFLADKVGLGEAMQLMRGKPGQKLALTLRRPANNQLVEVEMIREVIRESTVKDVALLESRYAGERKIGYVRLTQFNQPTVSELRDALDKLENDGMEALVLDMRNNPGGLLTSAVNTCGEFVAPGTVVLTTEGREAVSNTKVYRTSPRKERTRDYPMAILVNHASASGAEVVSGALQDLHRAIVVGQTTFGKGSVQSIIPVPTDRGYAIRMTTAKYYTPSKRTIHENGVEPNIVATLTPNEERRLMQWFRRDTLEPSERKKVEAWIDRQLARATDALKGALVYTEVREARSVANDADPGAANTLTNEKAKPEALKKEPASKEDPPEKPKADSPETPESPEQDTPAEDPGA